MKIRLVIGLGNPGSIYARTRHNLGFMVVEAFGAKQGIALKNSLRLKGRTGHGMIGEEKAILLLPSTYMNLSGLAVRRAKDYYGVAIKNLLVVLDDADLLFGQMRLRSRGSCGGHNGLASIEEQLKTQEYSRLRMGIGRDQAIGLEEYVLSPFNEREQPLLPQFIEQGAAVLDCWLREGLEEAMRLAATFKINERKV